MLVIIFINIIMFHVFTIYPYQVIKINKNVISFNIYIIIYLILNINNFNIFYYKL